MAYGHRLRELLCCVPLVVGLCGSALLLARTAVARAGVPKQVLIPGESKPSGESAIPPQGVTIPHTDMTAFLPPRAALVKQLFVDFSGDGGPGSIVLAYKIPNEREKDSYDAGVRVVRYDPASGWTVAFEDGNFFVETGSDDAIDIEKVRSSGGKEGLVVILKFSGAGTSTDWHVLATEGQEFLNLDPTPLLDKVLKDRGYMFMGYNSVAAQGDLVIEELPGYSYGRARCCPDRPSIEARLKFTGTSIELDSIKELPFSPPKD